jgi:putative transposase
MLSVIDEFTHECLAIRVDRKLKAIDVIDVLSEPFILRGVPGHIRSDNGPEFIAKAVQQWILAVGAKTAYTRPKRDPGPMNLAAAVNVTSLRRRPSQETTSCDLSFSQESSAWQQRLVRPRSNPPERRPASSLGPWLEVRSAQSWAALQVLPSPPLAGRLAQGIATSRIGAAKSSVTAQANR